MVCKEKHKSRSVQWRVIIGVFFVMQVEKWKPGQVKGFQEPTLEQQQSLEMEPNQHTWFQIFMLIMALVGFTALIKWIREFFDLFEVSWYRPTGSRWWRLGNIVWHGGSEHGRLKTRVERLERARKTAERHVIRGFRWQRGEPQAVQVEQRGTQTLISAQSPNIPRPQGSLRIQPGLGGGPSAANRTLSPRYPFLSAYPTMKEKGEA